MNEAVQDRIGQGGVSDPVVPLRKRDLGRHECCSDIVAVFKDFEEILAVFGGHGRKKKVFNYDDVLPGQILQEARIFSGVAGNVERLEEAREADQEDPVSHAAGLVSQGFSQVAFANAGRPGDEDVLVVGDPLAGEKRLDQGFGKVPGTPEVEVLGGGVLPEPGRLETPLCPSVFLNRDLPVDQKTETVFKGEIGGGSGGALLILHSLEEACETEGLELFFQRVDQHLGLLGVVCVTSNGSDYWIHFRIASMAPPSDRDNGARGEASTACFFPAFWSGNFL